MNCESLCSRLGWPVRTIVAATLAILSCLGTARSASAQGGGVGGLCTISATSLSFGAYDPIVTNKSTNLDGTATVTINCTVGLSVTIGLDAGQNSTHASGTTRAMVGTAAPTPYLSYEIYQNSGRTSVWCNSGACLLNVGTVLATTQNFTAFGRIPSGQNKAAGNYTDTVVATVNF